MHFEELFEPIEVISHFKNGNPVPLRFKWNQRTYSIKKINGKWHEYQGAAKQYHFSVNCDSSDCFELLFDTHNLTWQLLRVCLEG